MKIEKAIEDCDIIFANLEDMMSEEASKKYIRSYKKIRSTIYKIIKLYENNKEDISYSLHDMMEDLEKILGG